MPETTYISPEDRLNMGRVCGSCRFWNFALHEHTWYMDGVKQACMSPYGARDGTTTFVGDTCDHWTGFSEKNTAEKVQKMWEEIRDEPDSLR